MNSRFCSRLGLAGAATLAVVLCIPANTAAQARGARATQPAAAKTPANAPAKGWTKKTADGQPDLQGFWSTTSSVPWERPANCGAREYYTDEEMKAGGRACIGEPTAPAPAAGAAGGGRGAAAGAGGGRGAAAAATPNPHYDLAQFGLNARTVAESSRTSMVTGPEGRIPPLSEFGQQRQSELAAKAAELRPRAFDRAENRSLTERCILWNAEGPPVIAPGYNSNLQIIQGQGYVMILQEMMHDARIIPIEKGRPHLAGNVGQWFGDSRGYWEGDTLVVETKNYNGRNPFRGISSDKLKVTERFKRLDEATLQYAFTIEDPVWTKPWSAVVSWAKTEGPLFEYACHEGNYGMENILNGARVAEREAAEAAAKAK